MKLLGLFALPVLSAFLLSCRAKGPVVTHERLDASATSLRATLNADVGKVRVLMLVSPT